MSALLIVVERLRVGAPRARSARRGRARTRARVARRQVRRRSCRIAAGKGSRGEDVALCVKDGLNSGKTLHGETAVDFRDAILTDVVERVVAAPFKKDQVVVIIGGIEPGDGRPEKARVGKLLDGQQVVGFAACQGSEYVVFGDEE